MDSKIHLGRQTDYPDRYDSSLLVAIPRSQSRSVLGLSEPLPFVGTDVWTAFEVSWLNMRGKPTTAVLEFSFDARSPNIVESKSFKYYLNSFNGTQFADASEVLATLKRDLSRCSGSEVDIAVHLDEEGSLFARPSGQCVDHIDVKIDDYAPNPSLLEVQEKSVVGERLYSDVFKSNCPVTGQPDWATVWIEYSGRQIDPASFLRYIVSYRRHQDFHESCVERMFCDLRAHCSPDELSVFARYTRRGGLDINPLRSTAKCLVPFGRLARQ